MVSPTTMSLGPCDAGSMDTDPEEKARRDRDRYYQRTYGISHDEYDALLEAQGGRCAICRNKPKKRRLAVDHNHKTGLVRGLLCSPACNYKLLGRRDGKPEVFLKAYEYLTEPPAVDVIGEKTVPRR